MTALLVPSLSSLDLAHLNEELGVIRQAGLKTVHVDVCDGHFAPEITVGQPVVQSLVKAAGIAVEAHLRVERPERFVKDFVEAGVSRIAIHPESTCRLLPTLKEIRKGNCQAGVALNAEMRVDALFLVLPEVDFVILLCGGGKASLSNQPASNGQMLCSGVVQRLESAVELRQKSGLGFAIAAEGWLTREQAVELEAAGADALIASGKSVWLLDTDNTIAHSTGTVGLVSNKAATERPLVKY